jgi:hypothetical protein
MIIRLRARFVGNKLCAMNATRICLGRGTDCVARGELTVKLVHFAAVLRGYHHHLSWRLGQASKIFINAALALIIALDGARYHIVLVRS